MSWSIDRNWTLFLDRDGVINVRNFGGYITSLEEFKFRSDFLDVIPYLSEVFERIIVVTNQQGIGKKVMNERNLLEIHTFMSREIARVGGKIDKVYFASNLKGESPDRRKPQKAMGLEAKMDFPAIDFEKSIMVGDTDSDIRFGKNLGMKTVLLSSDERITETADVVIDDLKELKMILK